MNYASFDDVKNIVTGMAKKIPHGVMLGNTTVGHIEWQMYLQRDYLKLDGTPLANASNDYDELLKFAQDNSLITADTIDKSLFKYDSTNDVLTLPDYIGLCLQGGNTIEEKEAGLPNITGAVNAVNAGHNSIGAGSYGAFSWSSNSSNHSINAASTTGRYTVSGVSIDASQSNSIYGNSTTVQPPAITLIPQIKYKKATVHEGIDLNKLMPLGTVINFMGTTAPDYYLACDGTIYNILEYSALANFFEEQFGSVNHFGGDGTTTFAVPDLRGEFLRGTGTNSHTNQGSGASVGVHQDGTEHRNNPYGFGSDKSMYCYKESGNSNEWCLGWKRAPDYISPEVSNNAYLRIMSSASGTTGAIGNVYYTSRPTNTSVLYCIKYK